MSSKTSLSKNTALLYVRIIVVTLVTLFTSRFVLNSLGDIDYGVFNVIFGIVAAFQIMAGALIVTGNRFLISDMVNNKDRLPETFSLLLFIHLFLAVFVGLIVEIFGLYMINNQLSIPSDRLSAAYVVFQLSVFNFFTSIVQLPFQSVLISNERFDVQAYCDIFYAVVLWVLALIISFFPGDVLINYAIGYVLIHFMLLAIYIIICRKGFEYVNFRIVIKLDRLKKLLTFASWNFMGASTLAIYMQGTNMILNMHFGPLVNTSRGIAFQVNTALNKLGGTIVTALGPRMTKSYDEGDITKMNSLAIIGAKYNFAVMMIFCVPIFLSAEYILQLWLGQVPRYATEFVRLIVIYSLVSSLSSTLLTVNLAVRKVKSYFIFIGAVQLAATAVSYIVLKYTTSLGPNVIFLIYIITALVLLFGGALILKINSYFDFKRFITDCIFPCVVSATILYIVMYLIFGNIDTTFLLLVAQCLASILIGLIISCLLIMKPDERVFVLALIKSKIRHEKN